MATTKTSNSLLRMLPSIDSLLKTDRAQLLRREVGADRLSALARQVTDELRNELLAKPGAAEGAGLENGRRTLIEEAEDRLVELHHRQSACRLRRVINATGVVLHTNLGRAPLSDTARRAIDAASGYCSLEYDIATGARGRRGGRAEDLLAELTGAESALVVNNCAAAALLALTVLANGGETIVSRGELVEIGGGFRVPDVMAQSGTRMVEVGTTNRTRLSDYRRAISENTRMVMRVHPSNYRIVGFTKTPALSELAELSHSAGLLLYEDAGSGALVDLTDYGIKGEPVIRESIKAGADVVSFSGDKLLGGPQGGLLVGRSEIIERMRKHPLYRALRADKLSIAAFEATLEVYCREEKVPVHQLISLSATEIGERARKLVRRIRKGTPETIKLETIQGESAIGGGSAPTSPLSTVLISLTHTQLTANQIEAAFRNRDTPIIVRIVKDEVLIDLRTVAESEESEIEQAIRSLTTWRETAQNFAP